MMSQRYSLSTSPPYRSMSERCWLSKLILVAVSISSSPGANFQPSVVYDTGKLKGMVFILDHLHLMIPKGKGMAILSILDGVSSDSMHLRRVVNCGGKNLAALHFGARTAQR